MKNKLFNFLTALLASWTTFGTAGAYATLTGSTKTSILAGNTNGEEIGWEPEIVGSAMTQAWMSNNMTGRPGSGKPIISYGATKTIAGQSLVISTDTEYGGTGIQGLGTRPGQAESLKTGGFLLKTSIWYLAGGIDMLGLTQTVHGKTWNQRNKEKLARGLSRKFSTDALVALRNGGWASNTAAQNVVFPNGKTFDTISSSDTYSYAGFIRSGGALRDIGAKSMDAAENVSGDAVPRSAPMIPRYMQLTTDQNARPIQYDSDYKEAIKFAMPRGEGANPAFTGEYVDINGMIAYNIPIINHDTYGPLGSIIQPDAALGVALGATSTLTTVTGGGTAVGAAYTPFQNHFEAFERHGYVPINGVATTHSVRVTYGYFMVINATNGKVSYFRYTTNTLAVGSTTPNTLSGLKRLAAANLNDELTTIGDMTWGVGAMLTTPDGNGFLGLDAGEIPIGSKVYQCNSKGVPVGYGFGLGEMALVCGFGQIAKDGGRTFKSMADRVFIEAPGGNAWEEGIQVAWGCTPFLRTDSLAPNYVVNVFARSIPGAPSID